jgi:hypothetical protein
MGYDIYPALPFIDDSPGFANFNGKVGWAWTGAGAISPPYVFPYGLYSFSPHPIRPVLQAFPYAVTAARKMATTYYWEPNDPDDFVPLITSADQLFQERWGSSSWKIYGSTKAWGVGNVDYAQSDLQWQGTVYYPEPGPGWHLIAASISAQVDFPYQQIVFRSELFTVNDTRNSTIIWYWKESAVGWQWCLRWRTVIDVPPITSGRKSGIIPILAGVAVLSGLSLIGGGVMVAPSVSSRRPRKS